MKRHLISILLLGLMTGFPSLSLAVIPFNMIPFPLNMSPTDPCVGHPNIGTVCDNGAIYAGDFQGSRYMVTAGQVTRTWSGGATDIDITGVSNITNPATPSSADQRGHVTTPIIVAATDGTSAASYCQNLDANGFDDWYLPSKSELNYIYCKLSPSGSSDETACGGVGGGTGNLSSAGFTTMLLTYYWSSTEGDSDDACRQTFYDGTQKCVSGFLDLNGTYKSSNFNVRCVRRY